MSIASEAVKRWRKTAKVIILTCMGGQCQICFYNKCGSALELHHIDPTEKEISIGRIMASCRSWDMLYCEIAKCILLCSNCHREVHAGLATIPIEYKKFSKEEADAIRSSRSHAIQHTTAAINRKKKIEEKEKRIEKRFKFNANRRSLVINSLVDMNKHGSLSELGRELGISNTNIRKWLKLHMPEIYALTPKSDC